jgi:ABC-type bacteriocin/lantibiotic exporter with double-glycine peptidase domain
MCCGVPRHQEKFNSFQGNSEEVLAMMELEWAAMKAEINQTETLFLAISTWLDNHAIVFETVKNRRKSVYNKRKGKHTQVAQKEDSAREYLKTKTKHLLRNIKHWQQVVHRETL